MMTEAGPASGHDLFFRVRGEYLEMPGLCLTLEQAQRLWALDRDACSVVLADLVRDGFLRRRRDGSYVRQGAGRGPSPAMHATRG